MRPASPGSQQAVTRFLDVESCGQCSACKPGLGVASAAIRSSVRKGSRRRLGIGRSCSAPQGNRCYLPVQGSLLIPALIDGFKQEFIAELSPQRRVAPEWLIPKLVDFDEVTRTFTCDERQASKQPDWTYAEPPPPLRMEAEHRGSPPSYEHRSQTEGAP